MSRYTRGNQIGTGGFGAVYRCVRDVDGAEFAMKALQDTDPDAVKRFQRETRILATLDHPRIVKIVGVQLALSPFAYVMPLYKSSLAGELTSMVGDADRIHNVIDAILEGMQYAHEQGVIHRDLKPENVLLNSDTDVVVTDFGLGRVITAASTRATFTGAQMGTFGYMAPEQLTDAKRADHRADIFALGRMLYELYTGNPPGITHDYGATPPGIVFIIERCTKTNPDERFQSVSELRAAIDSLRQSADAHDTRSRIEELAAEAVAKGRFDDAQAMEFADLLLKLNDDEDLMRELAIKLPESALRDLWRTNEMALILMVKRFTSNVTSQGWGFDYTDVIGGACRKLFDTINDPEARALLIEAVAEVGVDHNRWHVMGIAGSLLENVSNSGDGLAIATRLAARPGYVDSIEQYVDLAKVKDRNIRELFTQRKS